MRDRDEAGFTLIEMMLVMILLGFVAALSTYATVTVFKSLRTTTDSANTVAQVRQAIGTIERQVRSGNVLFSPASEAATGCQAYGTSAGTCMRVYTQLDGVRRCVQWQLVPDGGAAGTASLRTRSFSPAWASDGDVSAWRTAARGLLPGSSTTPPFVLQGGTTLYSSRLLDVTLTAPDPQGRGRPVTLSTSLSGRNTTYGFDSSLCLPGPA